MTNSAEPRYGVVAADLDADGVRELLVATRALDGCAQLTALTISGRRIWRHDFDRIPPAPPVWNVGGLTFWWPIARESGMAIFASVRRSTMHSDEGYLLDGRTGETVWRQPKLEPPVVHDLRGYGGTLVAAADLAGDESEEIICCYPDMAFVADSRTGEILHFANMADGKVFGGWTAYATPVIADFLRAERLQILWAGCTYATGLLGPDLKPIWTREWANAYGKEGVSIQAIGDFDGIGALQIIERGRDGVLRCFDGADGKERWSMPFDQISGCLVSCDIDRDGRDEAIGVCGSKLVAVSSRTVDWALDLPASGFTPAIADVDADGDSEIIVALTNGDVVCVADRR